ncbi:hypothetical protein MMO39_14485 [Acinetobacter modestus]|uniref:hypothetical protein n=1 Tax=Acinetobacter modestus TaxID=1776740 RepID=UPI001F4BC785|nr:hypothetical protein [Acinetobacter modestus]MCH7330910.1 hypothetical protein [Acinetobacter modestus]MCH7388494.1 hypothetical protein [Acinetobacter modestus]
MNKNLEQLCEVLDELSEVVLNSCNDDQILRNVYGWTHPPLTRQDLANIPKELSNQVRRIEIAQLEDNLAELIEKIPEKIRLMYGDTIPYMFDGSGAQAIPIFLSTLEWVRQVIAPLMGWEVLKDNKAMPTQIARRLRAIQIEIENIIPNKENLTNQISLINDATEAAENLPTDLKSLREARNQVSELEKDSSFDRKKVSEHKSSIEAQLKSISEMHEQAKQLIENCEEAYRITTTKGLAAAFDKRASDLKWSMRLWVGGLLFALAIGAFIGHERIQILTQALNNANISWGIISIQIVLSFTSVLAPLWFAWLATKQISQRFKLAEDYDFKASVAKAYEGYKKEAAKIDVDFEARLFNVALTRLEEAPLRLVDSVNHGSPTHEIIEKTSLNKVGEKIVNQVEKVVDSITPAKASNDN